MRRTPTAPDPAAPFLHAATLRRSRADRSDYPYSLPAVRELGTLPFPTPVTFFVGENGSGKSTLLEALAVACGVAD